MIVGITAAVLTALILTGSVAGWVVYVVRTNPSSSVARVVKGVEAFTIRAAESLKTSYRNNKVVWLLPTRGTIPLEVHVSLRNLHLLMNQPRACLEIPGEEVGAAYEKGVATILGDPQLKSFPWIWTYEEDNVQPSDAFFKLFDAIWKCIDCGADMPSGPDGGPAEPWVCPNGHRGLDAVGGLYRTKSEPSWPMAFGDVNDEKLNFRPIDTTEAEREGRVIEVHGLAMGCTLYRKAMFEKIPRPWFKTLSGSEPEGAGAFTQDLYFAKKAKEEIGARFAVHCGVQVGHLDVATRRVF